MADKTTFGVIVANRGFFPGQLCDEGSKQIQQVLAREGLGCVILSPDVTAHGAVESRQDAHKCADLFRRHADEIAGVLVTLPNFGDERAVTETLRLSGLDVPVLVHAFADDPIKMGRENRRDSFCGKMSICNNLKQAGIRYSLTSRHTMDPASPEFAADLHWFDQVCRVTRGLRSARLGAIGARPAAFKTVRYSEKILEASGIVVEVIDLYEVFGRVNKLDDSAAAVLAKMDEYRGYLTATIPAVPLLKTAKLAVVIEDWMAENELNASALQCWSAIEENYGIVPCGLMSMMSNKLLPSACEVDITGVVGMYALALASGTPAALLDWNNNYGDDPDKCVLFHCSNIPKACFTDSVRLDVQTIIADSVGRENAFGACVGRVAPGPFTFARVSTDDTVGEITAYVGEGEFTTDPLDTFGGYGVAHIENLQGLLAFICSEGFEHHVAITQAQVSLALHEALEHYMNWDVYFHE